MTVKNNNKQKQKTRTEKKETKATAARTANRKHHHIIMSSSRNDMRPSSSTTKTKSKAKSASFGFKRGFLNNNSSSSSSRSLPSSISRTTTVLSQLGLETVSTIPTAKTTASAPPPVQKSKDLCPICYYALPHIAMHSRYKSCCGESICMGCRIGQHRTLVVGAGVKKPIKGSKEEEREFSLICYSGVPMLCPFCRAEEPDNETEIIKRLNKQIEKYKDPRAMNMVGTYYIKGENGLPKNLIKAEELYKRAYDLGHPIAAHNLYQLQRIKNVPDEVLMRKYSEEGARRGNIDCMFAVGCSVILSKNTHEATRQFMMAAHAGHDKAMDLLISYYRSELISKEDLATMLRAHKGC